MSFHGGVPMGGCPPGQMQAPHGHMDVAPHVDMHAHVDHHAHVEHVPHVTENVHMDTQHMMVPVGGHQVYDVVGKTKMKKIPVKPGLRGKLFGPKVRAPVWKDIQIRPGGMKQDFAHATAAVPHRSVSAHTDSRVVHGAPHAHMAPHAHGTMAPHVDAGRYEYPMHADLGHHGHGVHTDVHHAPVHGHAPSYGTGQVDFHSEAALHGHDHHLPTAGTTFAPTIDLHNAPHEHIVDHVDPHAVHHSAPYADPHHQGPHGQVPEVEFTPMYTGQEHAVPHVQRAMAPAPPSPGAPQVGLGEQGRRSRRGSANPMVGGREASIMA